WISSPMRRGQWPVMFGFNSKTSPARKRRQWAQPWYFQEIHWLYLVKRMAPQPGKWESIGKERTAVNGLRCQSDSAISRTLTPFVCCAVRDSSPIWRVGCLEAKSSGDETHSKLRSSNS